MSHVVKSAIVGARILNKAVCFLAIFSGFFISKSHAQITVTYPMQDANFPTQVNNGGDFYNNGATELGMWANAPSTAKQTVGWQNFTTTGAAGGTARNLQVGDVFITTVAATRAFGQIGFSLNAGGTQGSSYANNISGSRMYISTDNYAAWSVKGLSGGATSSLSYVPLQDTFKDYRFTVRITSQTTADVYLTVDGTDYRAYNLALAGSAGANISAFSIFGSDMWDGNSSENAFWKQTTSVQNSGRVELGFFAAGATSTTPGLITDGLAANSTSVTSANAVFIGGNAGSQVNLNQANTYTGQTTVNSAARLEVQNAGALGGTSNGTTVSDGGALSLYQATGGITVAGEALNLAGLGVSGVNGALRNTGGNNAWNGAITLGASSRINADTTGSSGSLTIGGNISGGANVLFLGAQGASGANTGGNIAVSGAISGAGVTQDGTVTSVFKDGVGTLTLSGANNYTGDTRISAGNLTVSGSGTLGSGSDIFIGSAGSLSVNVNTTVASLQEWGTGNAGTVALGAGSTLTVNGADKGTMFQNSISGAGGLTMAGSGTSSLSLYGTQGYTGATTVSGGKISSGVALASSGITISGGTFETTAANIVADTSAVNVSAGTYALGGNDTVASLTISGGLLSSANASTLTAENYALQGGTVSANLGAGTATVTGATTTLNGTLGSTTVNVNSGTMNLGAADRLVNGAAVTVAGGTLGLSTFSDTVGSFTISSGTLGGSGTLTAGTYTLSGGTLTANLGSGSATASTGTTSLNGTLGANLTVNGGTVNLGSADRIIDSATVTVSSGTLGLGANNDTVSTFTLSGTSILGGSGTLTATSYALQGGTVSANLGAGTATVTGATTTLNGTLGSTTVNVNSGTMNLGAADRLANGAAVTVAGGTLGLSTFTDTVGSFTISSGTLGGSGTLTAGTYALNGGTVNANLGAGTATASTGTTSLNGALGANLTVSGGTVNLGSASRISDSATVVISSGELAVGGNDTVGSLSITGGTVSGTRTLTAATYALNGGTVSGKLGAGTVNASSGTTLLSGTSEAANVNVSGGLLSLLSLNRLVDTAAVVVSSGELAMGGSDTIGSLSTTGGTVSGSGTLTAATYALNGGTVSVNLGAGTVNASSGTTSLSGTSDAANVNVSGGTLNISGANKLADGAAVAVSSGTLGMGGNDTVGSLSTTGGTVSGTGTLTAATYALNGGTVSVNLGAGTVNASSGTTLLSGTSAAANVNVSGGLLSLLSLNRLADTAAVAVSSGTLGMVGDDTIGSLSTTGGTVSGSGTLTAATYALNGGTVSVKLGEGTVNTSSGTTSLSGTSAAANVNVSGGLLTLASANRLADTAAVAVSSGELAMGGNDTIGSLSTTGGTVSGTGILTAATYALNGGTVSANLGAGTVNASSGTTLLSGTSAAANVNVQGGTLNTGSANRLDNGAAVVVSSGTLGVGGDDTVGSLTASGTGVVTVASGTTLTANGNSSITGSARATGGTVAVANNSLLTLANSSTTTTSDLSIGSGSTLAGTGGTSGQIKGSGLLSPGNSPGILTSGSVDLTGGIDFAFEFTAAGAPTYSLAGNSRNDLLHLTSGSPPFSGSFSTGNTVSFYFNDAGLSASLASGTPTTYLGGFFVDAQNFDIAGLLSSASLQYFIAAANGTTSFNGVNYNLMSNGEASSIILSNVNQSGADFTTGTIDGTVLSVVAVPEPSSASLLLAGIGSLLVLRRFRKNA